MAWSESILCHKFDAPISIPEQDRVRISVLQKPFEEVIYNRMLRLSYDNSRNFCRISYSGIQETTSLRSKNAVITGIQGLIEKRHIIKLINEEGKPEMNREGTLYRVLSPQEALRGVLDDGMIVSEIDRDGMNFTVTVKKLHEGFPDAVQPASTEQGGNQYTRQGDAQQGGSRRRTRAVLLPLAAFALGLMLAVAGLAAKDLYMNHSIQGRPGADTLQTSENPENHEAPDLDRNRQKRIEPLYTNKNIHIEQGQISSKDSSNQAMDRELNNQNTVDVKDMEKSRDNIVDNSTTMPLTAAVIDDNVPQRKESTGSAGSKPIQKQAANPSKSNNNAATHSPINRVQSESQQTNVKDKVKKPVTKPINKHSDQAPPPEVLNPIQEKPLTIIE